MKMHPLIIEKERSYRIMQAAYKVHNSLGPGYLESIYENAMAIELRVQGFLVETQYPVKVWYNSIPVGEHILDMVVDGRIILELKAVHVIAPSHKKQALSYARATNLPLAIVSNFGEASLEYVRIVNTMMPGTKEQINEI